MPIVCWLDIDIHDSRVQLCKIQALRFHLVVKPNRKNSITCQLTKPRLGKELNFLIWDECGGVFVTGIFCAVVEQKVKGIKSCSSTIAARI